MNGTLIRRYEVHCPACEQGELGLRGDTVGQCEKELRRGGWIKVGTLWYHRTCAP